ncbi:MAG: 50S ribosomal protein L31 [Anaerolineae bacterium]|nr:50S ribosomal protein L31 [Anaerolineae bacterium]
MKAELHPQWNPQAKVVCACGATWTVGATVNEIRTDVCSNCHPFYTGEQRIVDTEGQVDRFMRRLRAREDALTEVERRKAERTSPDRDISTLGLGKRMEKLLSAANLVLVGDILKLMQEKGDDALTEIKGFGLKALADLKKGMRAQGYVLPGDDEPPAAETA